MTFNTDEWGINFNTLENNLGGTESNGVLPYCGECGGGHQEETHHADHFELHFIFYIIIKLSDLCLMFNHVN